MSYTVLSSPLPRIDLHVRAGQPLEVTVPILDGDGVAVPAAAFTGARAQVRASTAGAVLHTFTTDDDSALVTGGATGVVVLSATGAVTATWASWPTTSAWWDLEVLDADGDPQPLTAPGRLVVGAQVTR